MKQNSISKTFYRHIQVALLVSFFLSGCAGSNPEAQVPLAKTVVSTTPDANLTHPDEAELQRQQKLLEEQKIQEQLRLQTQKNSEAASNILHKAFPEETQTQELLLKAVQNAVSKGDNEAVIPLFEQIIAQIPNEVDWLSTYIEALLASQKYREARKVARDAITRGVDENVMNMAFWKAFDQDPLYGAQFIKTLPLSPNSVLKALGGGSTVTLKHVVDDQNLAAIKPDQDLRQSMYRSEIAFFRLCEILECSFDVPKNETLKVSKTDFNTLYSRVDSPKQRGYKSKFSHILWKKEADASYLYATYKEWVSDFSFFPIELVGLWKPYLQTSSTSLPTLQKFMTQLYQSARPEEKKSIQKHLNYLEGTTFEQLLHQISDIILIDFLTNNWDRFSEDINNYGANCHIHQGGLIAIDNGAAFPPWHTPRVEKRFAHVQKFSKKFVTNLRKLDTDYVFPKLFPEPTKEETRAWKLFVERRTQALNKIDKLIAQYGENAILF